MVARILYPDKRYYLTSDGRITHFTVEEMACKCGCGYGVADVPNETIDALHASRVELGKPMWIRSGVRCEAHNRAVGGQPESAHLRGLAVDLAANVPVYALWLLLGRHFRRVCMYSRSKGEFSHADMWVTDKRIWDVVTRDGNFIWTDFLAHYRIGGTDEEVNHIMEAT